MKILKRLFIMVLCCGLFLCGSGFTNKCEDVQKIELESNPTTGYGWYYDFLEESENRGKVNITETFKSDKPDDEMICGAGGTSIFEIKGERKGKVEIRFDYMRSRENKVPLETVNVTVHVNPEGKVKVLKYSSDEVVENGYRK